MWKYESRSVGRECNTYTRIRVCMWTVKWRIEDRKIECSGGVNKFIEHTIPLM